MFVDVWRGGCRTALHTADPVVHLQRAESLRHARERLVCRVHFEVARHERMGCDAFVRTTATNAQNMRKVNLRCAGSVSKGTPKVLHNALTPSMLQAGSAWRVASSPVAASSSSSSSSSRYGMLYTDVFLTMSEDKAVAGG